jgi:hypothetical protein
MSHLPVPVGPTLSPGKPPRQRRPFLPTTRLLLAALFYMLGALCWRLARRLDPLLPRFMKGR